MPSYDNLTPSRFKQLKPQFSEVPDETVQMYLDLGGRFVDRTWLEKDYETAWAAITCHLMSLDGLGTGVDAEIAQAGGSRLTSLKSGTLSITLSSSTEGGREDEFKDWLNQSACGRFYLVLLRLNKGGARLLTGQGLCLSGYAKDWPRT